METQPTGVEELLERALAVVKAGDIEEEDATARSLQADLEADQAAIQAERAELDRLLAERRALQREYEELRLDRAELADLRREVEQEQLALARIAGGPQELLGLNLGGERVILVRRSLLLQFEDSTLAKIFSGHEDHKLTRDSAGNVLLDYSPAVIIPLIEFLRLYRDVAHERRATLPLPDVPHSIREPWRAMLESLGLTALLSRSRPSTTVFSGVRINVPLAELHGWTQTFCQPYSHCTTMADFDTPPELRGGSLLVAARLVGSKALALAAMGNQEIVTQIRDEANTILHNGVHWYCARHRSVGFAPDGCVKLNPADSAWSLDARRLSWHLTQDGGWRAGSATGLNQSLAYEKVIFASAVRLQDVRTDYTGGLLNL